MLERFLYLLLYFKLKSQIYRINALYSWTGIFFAFDYSSQFGYKGISRECRYR